MLQLQSVAQMYLRVFSVGLQVRESLMVRAKEFNILMDDVAITHLSFGAEVRNALTDLVCSSVYPNIFQPMDCNSIVCSSDCLNSIQPVDHDPK